MLDISHYHVGGFPAAGMHDGAEVDAGRGHVLGGSDAHGMSGEFRDNSFIEASFAGAVLKDANNRVGMKRIGHRISTLNAAEDRSGIQVRGIEPTSQMQEGFRGQVGKPAVTELVGFRFAHQDRAGAVGFCRQVVGLQLHEFGAAAERVVADGDQSSVAEALRVVGAGFDELLLERAGEAEGLVLAAAFLAKDSAGGEVHLFGADWVVQFQ